MLLTLPETGVTNTTAQEGGDNHANETDSNGNVKKENYAQRRHVLNNFENIIGSNVSSGEGPHDSLTGYDNANVIDGRIAVTIC